MLARAETRAELAHDLGGAAQRGEFELRFQPIADLGDGSVRIVERSSAGATPSAAC